MTLEISNDIEANPTSLSACNDGTGTAIYDLTNLNFQDNITGGNGNSILWFEDAAANIPLSPPFDEFETTPTLIYAIVVNGSCSSIPVEISLTLSPEVPVVNNYSLSSCDDGNGTASFDLDMQEDVINLNNGNQVFWFADQNLTLAIASPFVSASTIIYAIATDGVCFSEIVEVELIIFDNLTVFPTTDTQCDDGNGTATFNLADLENIVNGGNGNTVNWYTDSVATILSPTMVTSGNTSVYAIVTDGNCLSEVVEITLIVENSLSAFSTIYTQCDDGNGTATFDLTTLENTVNGGTGNTVIWYTDSGATIPSSTSITSGNTSVYAIVTDGSCLSQIVEINLTIENIIVAFSTTDTQCDGGNGTAIFDLTTLENSVNGGSGNMVSWYTNAGATIPSPSIITSGNASVYAIVTDGICSSQIVEITLIVENSLTAFSTTDIQCDDGSGIAIFDLIALENIVSGGSGNTVIWFSDQGATIPSPTTILTGDTSVYAIVTNGICYSPIVEIILAVDNNLSAFSTTDTQCDDGNGTATFDLTIGLSDEVPIVNVPTTTPDLLTCIVDEVTIIATDNSPGNDNTYLWTGPGTIVGETTLTPTVSATGIYTLNVENVVSGCDISLTTIVNGDFEAPDAFAAANDQFDCVTFEVSLDGTNSATGPTISYEWSTVSGVIESGQNALNPIVSAPGDYTLLVTDNGNGCTSSSVVTVTANIDSPTIAGVQVIDPNCFGENNGSITLDNITGGQVPYLYSIDGGALAPINQFSFLGAGEYEILVQDANGCETNQLVTITDPQELLVELGDNQTIGLGEEFQLSAQIIGAYDSIMWSANCPDSVCANQPEFLISPLNTISYFVTVVDGNGCITTDQITINVEKGREVFIPNAFTPNGDGNNDRFWVYPGGEVAKVHEFRVFNRWGEQVFGATNFDPFTQDDTNGWDGTLDSKKMNPAVFVYYVDIEFIDGRREVLKGDVALRR